MTYEEIAAAYDHLADALLAIDATQTENALALKLEAARCRSSAQRDATDAQHARLELEMRTRYAASDERKAAALEAIAKALAKPEET